VAWGETSVLENKAVLRERVQAYVALTKPRVVMLAAFCALIGMLLASDRWIGWPLILGAISGISLLAAAGFVLNCHYRARDRCTHGAHTLATVGTR